MNHSFPFLSFCGEDSSVVTLHSSHSDAIKPWQLFLALFPNLPMAINHSVCLEALAEMMMTSDD
jgi:hypothetical protein